MPRPVYISMAFCILILACGCTDDAEAPVAPKVSEAQEARGAVKAKPEYVPAAEYNKLLERVKALEKELAESKIGELQDRVKTLENNEWNSDHEYRDWKEFVNDELRRLDRR